jgi:sugar phosphate isomerase/epimerase
MIFSYDEWPGGHNIAWSPYIWRRILGEWSGTVGLNYDPSHLVWLMIDQGRFIREFGDHILHFQAKDVHIDRDGLYERGSLSGGIGWQVPRIPGGGDAPSLRKLPELPSHRGAVHDLPHRRGRLQRPAAGHVHREGARPRRRHP